MKIVMDGNCEGGNTTWTVTADRKDGSKVTTMVIGGYAAVGGEVCLLLDIKVFAGERLKEIPGSGYPTPAGQFGPSFKLGCEFEVEDKVGCEWLRRYGNVLVKRIVKQQLDAGKFNGSEDYAPIHWGVYGE